MRIDRVRDFVLQSCAQAVQEGRQPGVRAQEVADALGIWRNDAAVDLNTLVSRGELKRSGKKNVLFYPAALDPAQESLPEGAPEGGAVSIPEPEREKTDAFSRLVGANGSLKYQIQAAKSAVSYPPNGLHMLITGQPGVGKSLFSEAVWQYATEIGAFHAEDGSVPFVRFNCAEYADNPQLLLSHLFGHKKGAFTGATENKEGLVEEAAGGILFLDEIHCLTHTGQELFFTLLDTGLFRRMGETTTRQSRFMLIGATSKPVSDVLLDTFRRRIPILIQIPNLSERPPKEKLDLIRLFFAKEANRLQLPIEISADVVDILSAYNGESNIGDLMNIIQIACAKSYFVYRTMSGPAGRPLQIHVRDLSIRPGHQIRDDADEEAEHRPTRPMLIRPGDVLQPGETSYGVSIYDLMDQQADSSGELSQSDMARMDSQYRSMMNLLRKEDRSFELLDGLISGAVLRTADEIMERASVELGRNYSAGAHVTLAMHLQHYLDRIRSGLLIYNPHLAYIQAKNRAEMEFLERNQEWLSGLLHTKMSEDEMGFLAVFLSQINVGHRMPEVGLIVVSCGRKTARSMVEFANRTFGTHYAHWVDNKNLYNKEQLFDSLCSCVKTYCGPGGALILSDVDSFAALEDTISSATGVPCRVVQTLDQWLVLEACKLMLTADCDLDAAYSRLCRAYGQRTETLYLSMLGKTEPLTPSKPPNPQHQVVLTLCTTGVGTAERVQGLLMDLLGSQPGLEIIPMSVLDDIPAEVKRLGNELKLIVGTIDPQIHGIPFISAEQLFAPGGPQLIEAILGVPVSPLVSDDTEKAEDLLTMLAQRIDAFAPTLDGATVVQGIKTLLHLLEQEAYGHPLGMDLQGRVFMHAAAMLERTAVGAPLEITAEQEARIAEQQEWFDLLSSILDRTFLPQFPSLPRGERFFFLLSLPQRDDPNL